jgi:hypothetical protein
MNPQDVLDAYLTANATDTTDAANVGADQTKLATDQQTQQTDLGLDAAKATQLAGVLVQPPFATGSTSGGCTDYRTQNADGTFPTYSTTDGQSIVIGKTLPAIGTPPATSAQSI